MGNSGHGRVIKDMARQMNFYKEILFLDDDETCWKQNSVLGGSTEAIRLKEEYDVIVAIGNADIRRHLQEKYESERVSLVSLIHSQAILTEDTIEIGDGTVVMANAVVQAGTVLGKGVIVNTASSIDHECRIGNYVHIAVGAHLAGNVTVGDGTWIGAGAVVSNNIHICENVIIGAGAAVVSDIAECGTYVGVPARKIKDKR